MQWDHSTTYQTPIGDFNKDGYADLLLRDPSTGYFSFHYGQQLFGELNYNWPALG